MVFVFKMKLGLMTSFCGFVLLLAWVVRGENDLDLKFSRSPSLDNVNFINGLLFDLGGVRSKLQCTQLCAKATFCMTFTFDLQGNCRGHDLAMTLRSEKVSAAGVRAYQYVLPDASWLESACADDGACPVRAHVECFDGRCVCTPGYYYSLGNNSCVRDCTPEDLQTTTYVAYPTYRISDHNLVTVYTTSLAACEQLCINYPGAACRSFEHNAVKQQCNICDGTALDWAEFWKYNSKGYNYYQRWCA